MKKIILMTVILVLTARVALAGCVTKTYTFPASSTGTIFAFQVNQDFDELVAGVNNIDTCNLVNLAVTTAKIANLAVTGAKIALRTITAANIATGTITANELGAGACGATAHGDLSATITTMHSASSTVISDPLSVYTSTNVEGALAEVAYHLGIASGTTPSTTTYTLDYSGISEDYTTNWTAAANATPTCSVTVATNTAPFGIIADLTVYAVTGPICTAYMPLSINDIPLATNANLLRRYAFGAGDAANFSLMNTTRRVVYRTTDGWNPAVTNVVGIGSPFFDWAISANCVGTSWRDFSIMVYLIK